MGPSPSLWSKQVKREKWKFDYTAKVLAAAAQMKKEWHDSRLAFWEERQKVVEEKIQKEGVKIDRSQLLRIANNAAQGFASVSNYSRQPTVEIDEEMIRDLNECLEKVKGHRNHADNYQGWLQLFRSLAPEAILKLNHDDYLYFFDERRKLDEPEHTKQTS